MYRTQYEEVSHILEKLLNGYHRIFGDKMLGFYLYGSLIWGDFDINSSDIDTLCVITSEVTADEMEFLRVLHENIINENPQWKERVEVHYAPLAGLRNFREVSFKMGNISPGEPLHIIDAGIEWLGEWYCVQEYAVTLFGIDKSEIIPHIEKSEFVQTIRNYARSFRGRVKESTHCRYSQSYVILTLCRALYTLKNNEHISKLAAAHWAIDFLPEYRELINNALVWRRVRQSLVQNPLETYILTEKFTNDIIDRFFDF